MAHSSSKPDLVPRLLGLLTLVYVLAGVAAMLWLAPKVPYADGWRLLASVAGQPFPDSLWHADNGHREVLPNLVRWADLRLFGANQWLQLVLGAMLALGTFVMLLRAMRLASAHGTQVRAAACAIAVLLFWFGSQRTLAHANEAVHAYLITLCLAVGIGWLQRDDLRSLMGAIALGAVATFSFGTGVACFAGFALVLWLRRRGPRAWIVLGAGAALTVLAYLGGNAGAVNLQFAPLAQLSLLLRWLAAPFAYAAWPVVDPDVAAQVPTALGPAVAMPAAQAWERLFGPFETATWPWLGIGAIGIGVFAMLAWRARRQVQSHGIVIVGLALAAFGLAAGGVVVSARTAYFGELHPDQLLATRYVVWSTCFWGGLLLAGAGLARPRRGALAVAMVALLLLPSQAWMAQLALRMRAAADLGAAMAASGVIDTAQLGETVPTELAAAVPMLERERATVFAWPEAIRLRASSAASDLQAIATSDWTLTPVASADGSAATRVAFRAESSASRLLVTDAGGAARGIAVPDARRAGYWIGWLRGTATNGLGAASLRRD